MSTSCSCELIKAHPIQSTGQYPSAGRLKPEISVDNVYMIPSVNKVNQASGDADISPLMVRYHISIALDKDLFFSQ